MNTIGANIRAYRQEIDMTLEQLSEKVGLAKSTLSRYESGAYEPSFDTVKDIAEALDVHPALLYGFVDVSYDSWFNELPADQQSLLMMFSSLDPLQKKQVLDYIEFLIGRKR